MIRSRPRRAACLMLVALCAVAAPASADHTDSGTAGRTPRPPRRISRAPSVERPAPVTRDAPTYSEPRSSRPQTSTRRYDEPEREVRRSRIRTSKPPGERYSRSDTPGVIRLGPPNRKAQAVTLDDGWNPKSEVLDLIEAWGIRGTAFLVGAVAENLPELPKRLDRMGWEVCSHTYTHKLLTGLSTDAIRSEIQRGMDAIEQVTGQRCPYFRPPGGGVNSRVVAVAQELGLTVVNWNTSLSDTTTEDTDPQLQVDIALEELEPGTILLGHFGGVHTLEVLRDVLGAALAAGYTAGTVTDLLQGTTPGPRNYSAWKGPAAVPQRADRATPRPEPGRFAAVASSKDVRTATAPMVILLFACLALLGGLILLWERRRSRAASRTKPPFETEQRPRVLVRR
ncbi:MAG TPA: polysaccharide deacetylase family protein [Actinomycetota bacterium]|nr:polysaccharide deacetylase family protein [Actinomycetota bacterium]